MTGTVDLFGTVMRNNVIFIKHGSPYPAWIILHLKKSSETCTVL